MVLHPVVAPHFAHGKAIRRRRQLDDRRSRAVSRRYEHAIRADDDRLRGVHVESVFHGYSHSTRPSSGLIPIRPRAEHEHLAHAAERDEHRRRVRLLIVECRPATRTSAAIVAATDVPRPAWKHDDRVVDDEGEAAMPQVRFVAPLSSRMLVRQKVLPVPRRETGTRPGRRAVHAAVVPRWRRARSVAAMRSWKSGPCARP